MCENNSVVYQALKVKEPFIRNVGLCENNSSVAHEHLKVKVQLFRNVGMWKQFFCNLPTFENEVAFPSKRRDIWKQFFFDLPTLEVKGGVSSKGRVRYVTLHTA